MTPILSREPAIYPEDMTLRNWLFNQWHRVGKLYVLSEYDPPVLESEALFTHKAGEEVNTIADGMAYLKKLFDQIYECSFEMIAYHQHNRPLLI